jgi:hypothetical protein
MLSSPDPATAVSQSNTTGKYSSVSVAAVRLYCRLFQSRFKIASRTWRRFLTVFTRRPGPDLNYIIPFADIDNLTTSLSSRAVLHHACETPSTSPWYYQDQEGEPWQIVTHLTQVVLPLSPDHGLLATTKFILDPPRNALQQLSSESWGEYICLVGAVIR